MIIRSTFHSRLRYLSSQNMRTASELGNLHEQITTGKRITKLSDEPWAVSELHQLREGLETQAIHKDSSNRAATILNTKEYALTAGINIVDRAKMLAVQYGNDTYSLQELESGAEEILMMKDRMREIANTDFHGRYLFAGEAYDTPPFDTTYSYVGSTTESEIDVSEVSDVTVGTVGSDVFQGAADIFLVLDDLAVAMAAEDGTNIRAAIDDLDDIYQQLDEYRTQVGMDTRMALDMNEMATNMEMELKTRLSNVEDADIADVLTRFSLMQTQYEVNLQLTAKSKSVTLFSRM